MKITKDTEYLTTAELAERWNMTEGSLRVSKSRGAKLPQSTMVSGKRLWILDSVIQMEKDNLS